MRRSLRMLAAAASTFTLLSLTTLGLAPVAQAMLTAPARSARPTAAPAPPVHVTLSEFPLKDAVQVIAEITNLSITGYAILFPGTARVEFSARRGVCTVWHEVVYAERPGTLFLGSEETRSFAAYLPARVRSNAGALRLQARFFSRPLIGVDGISLPALAVAPSATPSGDASTTPSANVSPTPRSHASANAGAAASPSPLPCLPGESGSAPAPAAAADAVEATTAAPAADSPAATASIAPATAPPVLQLDALPLATPVRDEMPAPGGRKVEPL